MSIASIAAQLKGVFWFVSAKRNDAVTGGGIKTIWVGTQAQYDALATKDQNTEYNIVAG